MRNDNTTLSFYFGTQNHYLTQKLFVQTLVSSQVIVDEFDRIAFDSRLKPRIIVHPPRDGSFEFEIGLLLATVGGVVLNEWLKGFFRGLLGKSLEECGHGHGWLLLNGVKKIFTTPAFAIKELPLPDINIDKSIKAKSDFFQELSLHPDIERVRIGDDSIAIEMKKFIEHISNDIERELDPVYVYQELQINKPILVARQQGAWGFINNLSGTHVNARMNDSHFKFLITSGALPLKKNSTPDIIKCIMQIDKKMVNGEILEKGKKILTVYECNGKKLAPLPADFKPEGITEKKVIRTQRISLFSLLEGKSDS